MTSVSAVIRSFSHLADHFQAIDGTTDVPAMDPLSSEIDTGVGRSTSSEYKPTTSPHADRATSRRRSTTPEDSDDVDYEPTPKRIKTARNSLDHTTVIGSKHTQGAVAERGQKSSKAVIVRKTSTSKAQIPVEMSRQLNPVIISDDESGEIQVVGRARQVAQSDAHSEELGLATSDQGTNQRRAGTVSETESTVSEPSLEKQEAGYQTQGNLNNKVDVCLSILSSLVTHQLDLPEETAAHIHQLIRTSREPKQSFLENLLKDLESQRALKARHRNMVKKLVEFVDLNNGTVFPKTTPQNEVDRMWTAFHEHVVSIVGFNNVKPVLSQDSGGYMTVSAENIAHSRIPGEELEAYVESLGDPLRSPHAQQLLFSALLCRWVFAGPEIVFKDTHSAGMLHLYSGILGTSETIAEGLARVQKYDQVATKLLLEDSGFQVNVIKRQKAAVNSLFEGMKRKVCTPSTIPSSMRSDQFASELIDFKMRLLLSPKDYRIHYVKYRTAFNASMMRAFDQANNPVSDAEAAGKKVKLCVFPALVCQDPVAITDGTKIEDVLVKNKRFLPTFQESRPLPPNVQLSKAVVLIQMDGKK